MTFSLFPDVLWWGAFFAPLILRIAMSLVFLILAREHHRLKNEGGASSLFVLALAEFLLAILFLIGLYTQLAALAGVLYGVGFFAYVNALPRLAVQSQSFYFLLTTVSLALFFLGAGPLAFDVPL